MAGSNPLGAFKGAAASTDQQKAALASMIAAQGSAGAESYKAEQAVQQEMAKAGRASVIAGNPGIGKPNMGTGVGPGELTQMLAARAAAPGQLGAQQMGQAGTEFTKYAGLIGSANNNYMDAVKGALPIVQSQTSAQIAQINADLAQKRIDRQQAADDAATQRDRDNEMYREHIEDRMLDQAAQKKKDEEAAKVDANPYNSMEAGRSLGYKPKEIATITSAKAYQDAYPEVLNRLKALGPSADENMIRGVITSVLDTPNAANVVYGAANHPKTVELILNQVLGAYGKPLPTYVAPPPPPPAPPAPPLPGQTAADKAAEKKRMAANRDKGNGTTPHYNALTLTTMSEMSLKRVIDTYGKASPDGKRAQHELDRRNPKSGHRRVGAP
jgi:hypothetical protein